MKLIFPEKFLKDENNFNVKDVNIMSTEHELIKVFETYFESIEDTYCVDTILSN